MIDKKTVIDGVEYAIPIIQLPRSFDILDKTAERTEDGGLYREVLGTYLNHDSVVFGTLDDVATYDSLIDVLIKPIPFHVVSLPISNKYGTSKWYISGVKDTVDVELTDGTHFKALTCNLKAVEPILYGKDYV